MLIKVLLIYILTGFTLWSGAAFLEVTDKFTRLSRKFTIAGIKAIMVILGMYFFLALATGRWI